ncbi:hypothetical protein [Tautonia marina]|uniref:hypothetical protein n=1 Tax=Tautonia marina TaxID=2653855 RepID=UPI001F460F18|nr:hypothetical protein [Tautonia marina]
MSMRFKRPGMSVVVLLVSAENAWAGMPSITLTDLARMRIQTLSFFLLGILICSWIVQRIWNGLSKEFSWLPRLTFGKALGLITLWGFLFVLILTMISGARELMTPGAWEKQGLTYTIADESASEVPPDPLMEERRRVLDRLRIALWSYARSHDGRFPSQEDQTAIPDEAWQVPDPCGMRYRYVPGQFADEGHEPLVYEPGLFGLDCLVLLTDGRIVVMSLDAIEQTLDEEQTP